MLTLVLSAALLQQVPATPPPPPLPSSPIARLVIAPGTHITIPAQDTVRLRVQAFDAAGQELPNVAVRFFAAGGRFEGAVDSTGLVQSGSTGTLPVTVLASVPGSKPVIERVEVTMVAGPVATIAITPGAAKLVAGQRLQLHVAMQSKTGDARTDPPQWASSAPGIVKVGSDGIVQALAAGKATVSARVGAVTQSIAVQVVPATIASVTVTPAKVEAKQGDVVKFGVVVRDKAGRELAGLTPTWTFAPGQGQIDPDGTFVGYAPGTYYVTASFGSRAADAAVTLAPRNVRRPATVVGRLPRPRFTTEEIWVHPDGKHVYLGSGGGGDVLVAIDISDPSKPVITDSIIANTRRVNDVMTSADGKILVFTREGASDRKNGIVICDASDPAHPKPISEFTDGVSGGVHSSFVYTQPKYGTHVYLTNDATGALHIVDLNDPLHPKRVATYKTDRPEEGRSLHDIDVQDGLLYGSWWNDGLVILDVGNGMKGGSPEHPVLVSQFKYDLNALYRDVEASGGPGFIRGTHTAWRHGKYVFIADEVFPASPVKGAKDASAGRAYGRLQAIDVSDIEHPKSVAWYEPEFGGVHNVWVAGDTLYMGAYNAGFRAFDISGELRGDLRAQGREMVHVNTADLDGKVKNAAMAWGVVVRDGLAYVNDMYNGMWVIRMEPVRQNFTP